MEMNIEKCCRVCTSRNAEMISIFEYYKFCEYYLQIFKVITKCASVQIEQLDGYSEQICGRCIEHLCQAFSFKQLCENSDYKFRHNLLEGNKTVYQDAYYGETTTIQSAAVNENDIMERLCISRDVKSKKFYPEKAPSSSRNFEYCEMKTELTEDETEIADGIFANQSHEDGITKSPTDFTGVQNLKYTTTIPFNSIIFEHSNEKTNCHWAEVKDGIIEKDEKLARDVIYHCNDEIIDSSEAEEGPYRIAIKSMEPDSPTNSLITFHKGEKTYNCDLCEKKCATSSNLLRHIRYHTGEKQYKCDFCDKRFAENSTFAAHIRQHTEEKLYECEFCDKKFSGSSHLVEHIRLHTGEKPFKCDFCEKKFTTSSNLMTHVRLHTGEKPYKCDFCEKKFAETSHLAAHIRRHTGEKQYICDFCDRKFITTAQLADHVRSHTGEKPFKCDFCEKDFTQRSTLASHINLHAEEKRYKCDFCERKFTQKSTFTVHIKTHTGEMPYECDFCAQKFTSSSGLAEHVRDHTGGKVYNCDFCEKMYFTRSTLTKHIRNMHTEQK